MMGLALCGVALALAVIAFVLIGIMHHMRNIDWWLQDIKGKIK